MKKYFLTVLIFCLLFGSSYAFNNVNYMVDITKPESHFFEVSVKIENINKDSIDLLIPKIIPGTYEFSNYAKDVQEFSACDENNKPLKWEKVDLHTWKIYMNGSKNLIAKYRVYASKISFTDAFLNSQKAFINEASLLMYVKDKLETPCVLNLKYPVSWKADTTLKKLDKYTYTAPDYHHLIDRPIIIGNIKESKFKYKNVEYTLAIDEALNFDMEKFTENTKEIVKKEVNMMKEASFSKYNFFYLYLPDTFDALEHSDCTVMIIDPYNDSALKGTYWLIAHEFFHSWNDKCIYAKNIYPFRYNNTDYTRLYWFFEGFTSYYTYLTLAKCKIYDHEEFYKKLINYMIKWTEESSAKKIVSAEDASFTCWFLWCIEPQNKDENLLRFNRKGALVALLTDLKIRHDTKNKKSLDDVMRYLYKNYGLKNKGVAENELEEIFEKASGVDLKNIFTDYIKGTKDVDYNKYLNYAGLNLEIKENNIGGWLGIKGEETEDGVEIKYIERNSPAYEAGLSIGDIIIAVNGVKIYSKDFIANFKPYEKVDITLFRNNVLMIKQVIPGKRGEKEYKIVEVKNPTKLQREILKSWLEG